MKAKDIRGLSADEIRQRITEEEDDFQKLRFQHAVAALPNPMVLRQKRRLLARLRTILRDKELAGETA